MVKITEEILKKLDKKPDWLKLIPKDNRLYLLQSNETFTVYKTLVDLLELPLNHPIVKNAKIDLLKDPLLEKIISNFTKWDCTNVSGHNDPRYLPNQLLLLHNWGLTVEDDDRIKYIFEEMLSHIDNETNQFLAFGEVYNRKTKEKSIIWDSLLCDHHLITSLMLLFGYKDRPEVKHAINRIIELISETENGIGWKCLPSLKSSFRGPGRKNEVCPMLIVDVLRGFFILSKKEQPKQLMDIGMTLLECWSNGRQKKPYMFGHGKKFQTLRPPFFWYNVGSVLDSTSRYVELVKTKPFGELLQIALNQFDEKGTIIPKSIKTFFRDYSFGQKKLTSPWLSYYLDSICKRSYELFPKILEL